MPTTALNPQDRQEYTALLLKQFFKKTEQQKRVIFKQAEYTRMTPLQKLTELRETNLQKRRLTHSQMEQKLIYKFSDSKEQRHLNRRKLKSLEDLQYDDLDIPVEKIQPLEKESLMVGEEVIAQEFGKQLLSEVSMNDVISSQNPTEGPRKGTLQAALRKVLNAKLNKLVFQEQIN